MTSELCFALFGAGFWARYQLAAWGEIPGARCIAVCDTQRERAELLARRFGVAQVFDRPEEVFQTERPDFVDIVTDVGSHAGLVRLAAAQGVAVVCQKPMAQTEPECEDLVRVCQQAGVPFIVHENWRWQAPLRHLKGLLSAGAIGSPFRCRIDVISGFDVFANQPGLREQPNFIIADMGCHLIDLARSYFGEAKRIACEMRTVGRGVRGEDAATLLLAMNDGRTIVTINMAYAGTPLEHECFPQTLVFVEGDKGSIEVGPNFAVRVTTATGTHVLRVAPPRHGWADPDYAVVHSSMVPCLADIAGALRDGRHAETDASDNLRTMRLVFAAYHSAREHLMITLESGKT
jgi:predicted dehydrogenase